MWEGKPVNKLRIWRMRLCLFWGSGASVCTALSFTPGDVSLPRTTKQLFTKHFLVDMKFYLHMFCESNVIHKARKQAKVILRSI